MMQVECPDCGAAGMVEGRADALIRAPSRERRVEVPVLRCRECPCVLRTGEGEPVVDDAVREMFGGPATEPVEVLPL